MTESQIGSMTISQLDSMNLDDLREMARALDITGYTRLKKYDLVMRLLRASAENQGFIFGGGILEIVQDGIGFLRSDRLLPGPEDVYVSQSQIRRFGLRTGDFVVGQVRPPKETEKYHGLLKVEAVNGLDPEEAKRRPNFEKLTPIFPNEQVMSRNALEHDLHAHDRPVGADRTRPARTDRQPAQGRQDDRAQARCQRHHDQLSRTSI